MLSDLLLALETAPCEESKASSAAALISEVFADYYRRSREMAVGAKHAFETMDWKRSVEISRERIVIYTENIDKIVPLLHRFCAEFERRDSFWWSVEQVYLNRISGEYQADLAYAFLNSVRRKVLHDQWKPVEYSYGSAAPPSAPDILCHLPGAATLSVDTVIDILRVPDFATQYRDLESDAVRVASRVNEHLGLGSERSRGITVVQVIDAGFYRNRGAYVVGCIETADGVRTPMSIALLNEGDGIFVDAVILDADHLQYVFSSTLANFHVTSEYYHELAHFLFGLMPKRPLGLHYSTIGFNHVGKITVMRGVEENLSSSGERLGRAVGFPGTVAIGFSSASSEFVLKVIRNHPTPGYKWGEFPGIDSVLAQYRRVHEINRTGSMLDNVIYYNITLPGSYFTQEILHELLCDASANVSLHGDEVVFKHLIVQMKMSPLPLFLETATVEEAATAVRNLGLCIKNNAAANIFNKDLDGRNYGVSKILKVYLFDYDALEPLTNVKIYSNADRYEGEEDVPDWFFEDGFVFLPEEMELGLRIHDRELTRLFRKVHGDLLTLDYWTDIQNRLLQGRVPRIHTYPPECCI